MKKLLILLVMFLIIFGVAFFILKNNDRDDAQNNLSDSTSVSSSNNYTIPDENFIITSDKNPKIEEVILSLSQKKNSDSVNAYETLQKLNENNITKDKIGDWEILHHKSDGPLIYNNPKINKNLEIAFFEIKGRNLIKNLEVESSAYGWFLCEPGVDAVNAFELNNNLFQYNSNNHIIFFSVLDSKLYRIKIEFDDFENINFDNDIFLWYAKKLPSSIQKSELADRKKELIDKIGCEPAKINF